MVASTLWTPLAFSFSSGRLIAYVYINGLDVPLRSLRLYYYREVRAAHAASLDSFHGPNPHHRYPLG